MLRPLVHEAFEYLSLTFGVDQIQVNRITLHEAVNAGYGLELVVETVIDEHYSLVAVVLEV